MSCPTDCHYLELLHWIEDKHTLHKSVEFLYVIDGYEVHMMEGETNVDTFHGETLMDALRNARDKYPFGVAKNKHQH